MEYLEMDIRYGEDNLHYLQLKQMETENLVYERQDGTRILHEI